MTQTRMTQTSAPQSAIDTNAFAEIKELMGDSFKEIISMCVQSLPQQLAEIETEIINNNADTLFNISHKMKSSCSTIGAFGLAEKAQAIEVIGRDGSADVSADLLNDIQGAMQQVLVILNSELEINHSVQ